MIFSFPSPLIFLSLLSFPKLLYSSIKISDYRSNFFFVFLSDQPLTVSHLLYFLLTYILTSYLFPNLYYSVHYSLYFAFSRLFSSLIPFLIPSFPTLLLLFFLPVNRTCELKLFGSLFIFYQHFFLYSRFHYVVLGGILV